MSDALNCEQVERDELDLKYLHGRLSPDLAERFEAHFFGCERCWALVSAGQELRATRPASVAQPRWRWGLLAAAVVVGAVGIGLWRAAPRQGMVVPDTLRAGPAPNALDVRALAGDSGPTAVWSIVSGAASYRVRLYTRDGAVVLEREIQDTSFGIARDSPGGAKTLYWQVLALDRLGAELARSGLIETAASPPRPVP